MSSSAAVEARWHTLPDGVRLEVLYTAGGVPAPETPTTSEMGGSDHGTTAASEGAARVPEAAAAAPARSPLLFIHGSFHGAWCWAEHFLPHLAATTHHDCYALSLRGHGASGAGGVAATRRAAGTLESHLEDIASFVATLPMPPVLIVHSFAGLLAAKYVSELGQPGRPPLAGLALLGAVPPSGTGAMGRRMFWRHPLSVLRVAWSFIFQTFQSKPASCRWLFFSEELPAEDLERYRMHLAAHSGLTPTSRRPGDHGNKPPPAAPPPGGWVQLPGERVFVGLGGRDVLVDKEAAEETAVYFGCPGGTEAVVVWERLAHDVMLDCGWQEAAESLGSWLAALPPLA